MVIIDSGEMIYFLKLKSVDACFVCFANFLNQLVVKASA